MGGLRILEVEYEVVELLGDFVGAVVLARCDRLFQLVDQRAHFVGVFLGGLGEESAGLGQCLVGLRKPLWSGRLAVRHDRSTPSALAMPSVVSWKISASRSLASPLDAARKRVMALSMVTSLLRPVSRSRAVTLSMPFRSSSKRTRISLPSPASSLSPSSMNSPDRFVECRDVVFPLQDVDVSLVLTGIGRVVNLRPHGGQWSVAANDG